MISIILGEALQEKNSVQPPSNVSNNVPVSEPAVVQSPPIEQVEHRPTANDETETTRQINEGNFNTVFILAWLNFVSFYSVVTICQLKML